MKYYAFYIRWIDNDRETIGTRRIIKKTSIIYGNVRTLKYSLFDIEQEFDPHKFGGIWRKREVVITR